MLNYEIQPQETLTIGDQIDSLMALSASASDWMSEEQSGAGSHQLATCTDHFEPLSAHSRAWLRQIDATGAIVDLEDIGDPLRAVRGHSLNVKKAGWKHQR